MTRFLKEARVAAHLTQADVATRLGVSIKSVQRWEAGEQPSKVHAQQIAAFINQLDIVATGHLLPPRPHDLRAEATRLVTQCTQTAEAMIRSDETNPPGWKFHLYVLVDFLRRAAAADGMVFVEEAEYIIGLQRLGTNWRVENYGSDRWMLERQLLLDALLALKALGNEDAEVIHWPGPVQEQLVGAPTAWPGPTAAHLPG